MQVFVGASNDSQKQEAKEWICRVCKRAFLDELESWISSREAQWGPCHVFVEITVPQGGGWAPPHNQIDLLIAFGDRVAHCEQKKSYSYGDLDLERICRQVNGQVEWLTRTIRKGGFSPQCVRSFLFLPRLKPQDISRVAKDLIDVHAAHHIAVTSSDPILRDHWDGRHFFYLIQALENELQSVRLPQARGQPGLQEFFSNVLTKNPNAKLRSFANFREAKAWLQTVISNAPDLHRWHVAGLRNHELGKVRGTLKEAAVVEILGAPGVGKSIFAKELVRAIGLECIELNLRKCHSPHDVCCRIIGELHGEFDQVRGEETLVQQLASEPYALWINYDEDSRTSLDHFLRSLKLVKEASGRIQSRWIIESVRPLESLGESRQELGPLSKLAISRILAKVDPGNPKNDAEFIAHAAKGNPGRALRLWMSRDPENDVITDQFEWFRRQLSRDQARILPVVCLAASKSPLGITTNALKLMCRVVCTDLPAANLHEAVESLLDRMVDLQLARVIQLDRDAFGGLLNELLPETLPMTVVSDIPPGLVEDALRSMSREKLEEHTKGFHDFLQNNAGEPYTLTYVTFGLNLGDLEPLFRSPFRTTHFKRILLWLDAIQWQCDSPRQVFLLKALRLLMRLAANPTADVEDEINDVDISDEVQLYASEVVRTRSILGKRLDPTFDMASWLQEVAQSENAALQIELYILTAMSLQHGRRTEKSKETWTILNGLLERPGLGAASRSVVVSQALAFLNRTKSRDAVMDEEQAHTLIQTLSRELLEFGLKSENIQLVCDALYYWVRSRAFREGRTSPSKVHAYTAALQFVEEGQGRPVRRLQVLLTKGSIHRHFCRQEQITWSEFRQHMEDGWECYLRALRSALALNHTFHALNAVSYLMDFCTKSLRFGGLREAHDVIGEKCAEALLHAERADQQVRARIRGEEEQNLVSTVSQSRTVLSYVVAITAWSGEREKALQDEFVNYVRHVLAVAEIAKAPGDRGKTRRQIDSALKNLHRAIDFAEMNNPNRNYSLLCALRPQFELLLGETRRLFVSEGRPFGSWAKLSTIYHQALKRGAT